MGFRFERQTEPEKDRRKRLRMESGFSVAGDTEPGNLRQTEKVANRKWGSELQGTQNQEKTDGKG